jgi:hypothetical protein
MIKKMMIDKRAGLNVTPAFSIQTFVPSIGPQAIKCWWGMSAPCNILKPLLIFKYFPCEHISSLVDPKNPDAGAYCSSITSETLLCLSKFNNKSINPYVEGIWGNWRVDTTYAYYSDRKESDFNTAIDTRTAGAIFGYKPFWNFNSTYLTRNNDANDVWVCNSTITQYNRKGYDIENKDPLGRYNSGIYGYNQQLPIAVVNNSRYRESMFDGFEDYDYQSANCTVNCSPTRHGNFGDIISHIDNTQKHTGKNSLRVDAGSTINLSAPVIPEYQDEKAYGMRVRVDSSTFSKTVITPVGTGFRGKYFTLNTSGCSAAASAATTALEGTPFLTRWQEQINFGDFNLHFTGPGDNDPNYFGVRWEGYIQPLVSGNYSFLVTSDDGHRLYLDDYNGVAHQIANRWDCSWSVNSTTILIPLVAGHLYKLRMDYYENDGEQNAKLQWKTPDNPNSWEYIPLKQVYSPDNIASATGTVVTSTGWCTKLDSVQVTGNALTDSFSLVQGKKMLISAWVKEGGNDCKCSTYTKSNININFPGSGSSTIQSKPAGSIIEGWQRYEGEFTIPANATSITVGLNNTGTSSAYFDDVRIHPYNANMKSFVYHSHNLKLMAELDENNYASFYEYDDDGTLTRVKKETVKGIKTITETRSALQKSVD